MPISYGTPANVTASEVVFSVLADVDTSFYDVKYPGIEWPRFVNQDQIISNINPGATTYAYMSRDRQGKAAFVGNGPTRNIPTVGQSIGAVTVPLAASACGAEITNEDARQYAYGFSASLGSDLGEVMRVACDELVERTVFYGDESLGWFGALSVPGVVVLNSGGNWDTATPEGMVRDINNGLTEIWEGSKTVFEPTDVFLPPSRLAILAQTPMVLGGTALAVTVLEYIKKNNVITAVTGKELNIQALRYLKGAGVGGLDRMILSDRKKENQGLPFPMSYTLGAPVPGDLSVKMFSEQKHGPYHVRQPLSMAYMDGL